jgi:Tol biopolymer transport system component
MNNPSVSGQPCETIDHKSCFDIFLYDRDTGLTRRSTQAINGGAADGDSIAPTVSEDGKWVAFWSAASNLVEGVNNTCQKGDANITCLYIYFYNVETGKIDWIPIRSIPGDPVFGVDRISLSADGRYVGFTVDQTTQIRIISPAIPVTLDTQENSNGDKVINTIIPGTLNNSEAMVYDRLTGNIELENQAQDGNPGDGPSSSPVLSADGRYVAFVSRSTNLVGGDTNNHSDVFFRDRETGEVELISISSIGWKGRGDSGLSFGDRGFYSLNISRDGRYVVFNSVATNLGQDLYSNCNKLDISVCNILYVHDRQSGSTEWINALANQDTSYFPQISSDGRWVTFMQTVTNCTSSQYLCSNVMLYDRQHAWMTNLTKFGEESPSLPWSYSESLKIPWEAWESPAITFSPDGKLLALAGIDSKVRIWQISDSSNTFSNDKPVEILEPDGNDSFSALAFNPGGDWLAAGTTLGTVYIWELSDGKIHYILKNQQNLIR